MSQGTPVPGFIQLPDSNSLMIRRLKAGVKKTQLVKMLNQRLCIDSDEIVDCKIHESGKHAVVTFSCLEALNRAFEIANKLKNGIYGMFDHTPLFFIVFTDIVVYFF